ncbi:MAG: 50S ribosomal protein L16 [Planctomycetota bacterium]|jgi:large subunit ribosomal protein L16
MPLLPNNVKFRKQHTRGFNRDHAATRGNKVSFGEYGIQVLEGGDITSRQIEAARVTATRFLGRAGKMWIRIFPHTPVTGRPAETRMGKGKGNVSYWCAKVKPGTVLFELAGVSEEVAREALRRQAHKLPLRARMVKRED